MKNLKSSDLRKSILIASLIFIGSFKTFGNEDDCDPKQANQAYDLTLKEHSLYGTPTLDQTGGTCFAAAASIGFTAAARKDKSTALTQRCSQLETMCNFDSLDFKKDPEGYENGALGILGKYQMTLDGSNAKYCDAFAQFKKRGGCCDSSSISTTVGAGAPQPEDDEVKFIQKIGTADDHTYDGLLTYDERQEKQRQLETQGSQMRDEWEKISKDPAKKDEANSLYEKVMDNFVKIDKLVNTDEVAAPYRQRIKELTTKILNSLSVASPAYCPGGMSPAKSVSALINATTDLATLNGLGFPTIALNQVFSLACPDDRGKQWQDPVDNRTCDSTDKRNSYPDFVQAELRTDQPVQVNFCAHILDATTLKSAEKILKDVKAADWSGANSCGPHSALIVGSRCFGGKLQYRLRNSWGAQCLKNMIYAPCASDETGDHWVPAHILLGSAFQLSGVR